MFVYLCVLPGFPSLTWFLYKLYIFSIYVCLPVLSSFLSHLVPLCCCQFLYLFVCLPVFYLVSLSPGPFMLFFLSIYLCLLTFYLICSLTWFLYIAVFIFFSIYSFVFVLIFPFLYHVPCGCFSSLCCSVCVCVFPLPSFLRCSYKVFPVAAHLFFILFF